MITPLRHSGGCRVTWSGGSLDARSRTHAPRCVLVYRWCLGMCCSWLHGRRHAMAVLIFASLTSMRLCCIGAVCQILVQLSLAILKQAGPNAESAAHVFA
jgi:hypothetical protein